MRHFPIAHSIVDIMHTENFIDITAKVLACFDRPASAREIVEAAEADARFAPLTRGRTPHKTVNARIAIDILKNGARSRFYRFAPASYGLRSLAKDGTYSYKYSSEYVGHNRRKAVAKENVATIPIDQLPFMSYDGMYDGAAFPLSILELLDVGYIDRRIAEERDDLKQLVSYAYLRHADHVICFERGSFTADGGEFVGKQSIGFGGHLNDSDVNLFDNRSVGFVTNIERELHEEVSIFRNRFSSLIEDIRFEGFLLDSSTLNGRRHLGIVAEVKLRERVALDHAGLGLRNLRWVSIQRTPNYFRHFEIWSQYLFKFIQEKYGPASY